MDKEKEIYLEARNRVFEIYGKNPKDKRYNCHHNIGRAEAKELIGKDFEINQLSNLIPMRIETHAQLHKRIELEAL